MMYYACTHIFILGQYRYQ